MNTSFLLNIIKLQFRCQALKIIKTNKSKIAKSVNYYYTESGLIVFTEKHHLARGYCCKCDCRHCPYKNSTSEISQKTR